MNSKNDSMFWALQCLEKGLQKLNWWQDTPPSSEALASVEPFCVDALTFAEWLQWIFIPKTYEIIATNGTLPTTSALLPIAEISWKQVKGNRFDIETLQMVIEGIDEIFNQGQMSNVLVARLAQRNFL